MIREQDENNHEFKPADEFLKELEKQLPIPPGQSSNVSYKRASLAQLAASKGVKSKISLWEKTGPVKQGKLPYQNTGVPKSAKDDKLAPVSEIDEERRSSTSSLLSQDAQAALNAIMPSPGTKLDRAARQEAVRFPSVMFGTRQNIKLPMRGPFPKPRNSIESSRETDQWRLSVGAQSTEGSQQERCSDEESDSSSEWHDASEIQVVLKVHGEGSVSSEATTVVPAHESDDDSTAESRRPVPVPALQQSDSPTLPTEQRDVSQSQPRSHVYASEIFHSAVDMLPLYRSFGSAASGRLPALPKLSKDVLCLDVENAPSGLIGSFVGTNNNSTKQHIDLVTCTASTVPSSHVPSSEQQETPQPSSKQLSAHLPASSVCRNATENQNTRCSAAKLLHTDAATPENEEQSSIAAEPSACCDFRADGSVGSTVLHEYNTYMSSGEEHTSQKHAAPGECKASKKFESPPGSFLRREFSEANLLYLGQLSSPEAGPAMARHEVDVASPVAAGQLEGQLLHGDAATPMRQEIAAKPDHTMVPANTPATPYLAMQQQQQLWAPPVQPEHISQAMAALDDHDIAPDQTCATPFAAMTPYAATEYDGDDVVMGDANTPWSVVKNISSCNPNASHPLPAFCLSGSSITVAHGVQTDEWLPGSVDRQGGVTYGDVSVGSEQSAGQRKHEWYGAERDCQAVECSSAATKGGVEQANSEITAATCTDVEGRVSEMSSATAAVQSLAPEKLAEALDSSGAESEQWLPECSMPAAAEQRIAGHQHDTEVQQEAATVEGTLAEHQQPPSSPCDQAVPAQEEGLLCQPSDAAADEGKSPCIETVDEGNAASPTLVFSGVSDEASAKAQAEPPVQEIDGNVNAQLSTDLAEDHHEPSVRGQSLCATQPDAEQPLGGPGIALCSRQRLYADDAEAYMGPADLDESTTIPKIESAEVPPAVSDQSGNCQPPTPASKGDLELQSGDTAPVDSYSPQPALSPSSAMEAVSGGSSSPHALQYQTDTVLQSSTAADQYPEEASDNSESCPARGHNLEPAELQGSPSAHQASSSAGEVAAPAAANMTEPAVGANVDFATAAPSEDAGGHTLAQAAAGSSPEQVASASVRRADLEEPCALQALATASGPPVQGMLTSCQEASTPSSSCQIHDSEENPARGAEHQEHSVAEQHACQQEPASCGASGYPAACALTPREVSAEGAPASEAKGSIHADTPAVHSPLDNEDPTGSDPAAGQLRPSTHFMHSPAISFGNPLAASATPYNSRRTSAAPSPAQSSLTGAFSNSNPLFAGTPGHPTPPSVTFKTFSAQLTDGSPYSRESGSTPASVGMKLAERLQEVASQLQQASPEPLRLAATPGQAMQTPGPDKFAADVAAMLQALEQGTPATALFQKKSRAIAVATTVQRKPGASRLSMTAAGNAGITMFDLEGFDDDGNRNSVPTPLQSQALVVRDSQHVAAVIEDDKGDMGLSEAELRQLRGEVLDLRNKVAQLEEQRELAVGMLAGYQGSISQLQDQHSAIMLKVQTENALLKSEITGLQKDKAKVESQFHQLYHEKYLPLKEEGGIARQQVTSLRALLAQEEIKARQAEVHASDAEQKAVGLQHQLSIAKDDLAAALTAATTAKQAEAKLEQKAKAESRRHSQAIAALEANVAEVKGSYSLLTRQYDEAVHKLNLAKQAKERAQHEMERKEEEICGLQVKLKELEGVLLQYKRENSKFFDLKERYKAKIAALEKDVLDKEEEKKDLVNMCSELMNKLEREGLSLDD